RRPGLAAVLRFPLTDQVKAARTAQAQNRLVFSLEQSRLDDAVRMIRHRDRPELPPGLAVVGGALDPAGPRLVTLDRGRGEDGAAGELDWLVLDRPQQPGRQLLGLVPGLAAVGRTADVAGPGTRTWAGLVEEEECLGLAAEQDGVPARKARLFGSDLRLRPDLAVEAGPPDLHVLIPLLGAAAPGGPESAGLHQNIGRGVKGGELRLLEDEHGLFSPITRLCSPWFPRPSFPRRAWEREDKENAHTASKIVAIPCPAPMHIVASP